MPSAKKKGKKVGVFGIGNRYRQDDGIGLAILKILQKDDFFKNFLLYEIDIGIFDVEQILENTSTFDLALFIDAATSKKYKTGTILSLNLDMILGSKTELTTTTHGVRITDFLKILKELRPEIMPLKVIIYAIVVPNIGYGEELSSEALNAIPNAIKMLKKDILDFRR